MGHGHLLFLLNYIRCFGSMFMYIISCHIFPATGPKSKGKADFFLANCIHYRIK
jgi:hypothetical protein